MSKFPHQDQISAITWLGVLTRVFANQSNSEKYNSYAMQHTNNLHENGNFHNISRKSPFEIWHKGGGVIYIF